MVAQDKKEKSPKRKSILVDSSDDSSSTTTSEGAIQKRQKGTAAAKKERTFLNSSSESSSSSSSSIDFSDLQDDDDSDDSIQLEGSKSIGQLKLPKSPKQPETKTQWDYHAGSKSRSTFLDDVNDQHSKMEPKVGKKDADSMSKNEKPATIFGGNRSFSSFLSFVDEQHSKAIKSPSKKSIGDFSTPKENEAKNKDKPKEKESEVEIVSESQDVAGEKGHLVTPPEEDCTKSEAAMEVGSKTAMFVGGNRSFSSFLNFVDEQHSKTTRPLVEIEDIELAEAKEETSQQGGEESTKAIIQVQQLSGDDDGEKADLRSPIAEGRSVENTHTELKDESQNTLRDILCSPDGSGTIREGNECDVEILSESQGRAGDMERDDGEKGDLRSTIAEGRSVENTKTESKDESQNTSRDILPETSNPPEGSGTISEVNESKVGIVSEFQDRPGEKEHSATPPEENSTKSEEAMGAGSKLDQLQKDAEVEDKVHHTKPTYETNSGAVFTGFRTPQYNKSKYDPGQACKSFSTLVSEKSPFGDSWPPFRGSIARIGAPPMTENGRTAPQSLYDASGHQQETEMWKLSRTGFRTPQVTKPKLNFELARTTISTFGESASPIAKVRSVRASIASIEGPPLRNDEKDKKRCANVKLRHSVANDNIRWSESANQAAGRYPALSSSKSTPPSIDFSTPEPSKQKIVLKYARKTISSVFGEAKANPFGAKLRPVRASIATIGAPFHGDQIHRKHDDEKASPTSDKRISVGVSKLYSVQLPKQFLTPQLAKPKYEANQARKTISTFGEASPFGARLRPVRASISAIGRPPVHDAGDKKESQNSYATVKSRYSAESTKIKGGERASQTGDRDSPLRVSKSIVQSAGFCTPQPSKPKIGLDQARKTISVFGETKTSAFGATLQPTKASVTFIGRLPIHDDGYEVKPKSSSLQMNENRSSLFDEELATEEKRMELSALTSNPDAESAKHTKKQIEGREEGDEAVGKFPVKEVSRFSERESIACIQIQAFLRGCLARKYYYVVDEFSDDDSDATYELIDGEDEYTEAEHFSCIQIQAFLRGCLVRKYFYCYTVEEEYFDDDSDATYELLDSADEFPDVESYYSEFEEEYSENEELYTEEENLACIQIQTFFRGCLVRKYYYVVDEFTDDDSEATYELMDTDEEEILDDDDSDVTYEEIVEIIEYVDGDESDNGESVEYYEMTGNELSESLYDIVYDEVIDEGSDSELEIVDEISEMMVEGADRSDVSLTTMDVDEGTAEAEVTNLKEIIQSADEIIDCQSVTLVEIIEEESIVDEIIEEVIVGEGALYGDSEVIEDDLQTSYYEVIEDFCQASKAEKVHSISREQISKPLRKDDPLSDSEDQVDDKVRAHVRQNGKDQTQLEKLDESPNDQEEEGPTHIHEEKRLSGSNPSSTNEREPPERLEKDFASRELEKDSLKNESAESEGVIPKVLQEGVIPKVLQEESRLPPVIDIKPLNDTILNKVPSSSALALTEQPTKNVRTSHYTTGTQQEEGVDDSTSGEQGQEAEKLQNRVVRKNSLISETTTGTQEGTGDVASNQALSEPSTRLNEVVSGSKDLGPGTLPSKKVWKKPTSMVTSPFLSQITDGGKPEMNIESKAKLAAKKVWKRPASSVASPLTNLPSEEGILTKQKPVARTVVKKVVKKKEESDYGGTDISQQEVKQRRVITRKVVKKVVKQKRPSDPLDLGKEADLHQNKSNHASTPAVVKKTVVKKKRPSNQNLALGTKSDSKVNIESNHSTTSDKRKTKKVWKRPASSSPLPFLSQTTDDFKRPSTMKTPVKRWKRPTSTGASPFLIPNNSASNEKEEKHICGTTPKTRATPSTAQPIGDKESKSEEQNLDKNEKPSIRRISKKPAKRVSRKQLTENPNPACSDNQASNDSATRTTDQGGTAEKNITMRPSKTNAQNDSRQSVTANESVPVSQNKKSSKHNVKKKVWKHPASVLPFFNIPSDDTKTKEPASKQPVKRWKKPSVATTSSDSIKMETTKGGAEPKSHDASVPHTESKKSPKQSVKKEVWKRPFFNIPGDEVTVKKQPIHQRTSKFPPAAAVAPDGNVRANNNITEVTDALSKVVTTISFQSEESPKPVSVNKKVWKRPGTMSPSPFPNTASTIDTSNSQSNDPKSPNKQQVKRWQRPASALSPATAHSTAVDVPTNNTQKDAEAPPKNVTAVDISINESPKPVSVNKKVWKRPGTTSPSPFLNTANTTDTSNSPSNDPKSPNKPQVKNWQKPALAPMKTWKRPESTSALPISNTTSEKDKSKDLNDSLTMDKQTSNRWQKPKSNQLSTDGSISTSVDGKSENVEVLRESNSQKKVWKRPESPSTLSLFKTTRDGDKNKNLGNGSSKVIKQPGSTRWAKPASASAVARVPSAETVFIKSQTPLSPPSSTQGERGLKKPSLNLANQAKEVNTQNHERNSIVSPNDSASKSLKRSSLTSHKNGQGAETAANLTAKGHWNKATASVSSHSATQGLSSPTTPTAKQIWKKPSLLVNGDSGSGVQDKDGALAVKPTVKRAWTKPETPVSPPLVNKNLKVKKVAVKKYGKKTTGGGLNLDSPWS